jgi:predicted secreted hydrolase
MWVKLKLCRRKVQINGLNATIWTDFHPVKDFNISWWMVFMLDGLNTKKQMRSVLLTFFKTNPG